jgi:hypothetical protein
MPKLTMPLAWSDNRLAHHMNQMVADYQFQTVGDVTTSELRGCRIQAATPDELANLLVAIGGLIDGTVQVTLTNRYLWERHESLHGMAARFRTRGQAEWINIQPGRLATLFVKSGRGLRPDVQQWWDETISPMSRTWRLRCYVGSPYWCRPYAKLVEEVLELHTDADMLAFKFRWA